MISLEDFIKILEIEYNFKSDTITTEKYTGQNVDKFSMKVKMEKIPGQNFVEDESQKLNQLEKPAVVESDESIEDNNPTVKKNLDIPLI